MCNTCILARKEYLESKEPHYALYLKKTASFDRYDPKNTELINSLKSAYYEAIKPLDTKLGKVFGKCKDYR